LSKFYCVSILIFLTSCFYNKDIDSKKFFFDTDEYYSKESVEKISYLDSLQRLSVKFINDSVSRKFLFELSTQYYYLNNIQKSFEVNKQVLKFSINAKDSSGIAKSYHYMGDCFENKHRDSAYFYYQNAEKLYRLLRKDNLVGKMLFNKAYLLFLEGNYLESEILVSNALQVLNKQNDKQLIFYSYNLLGSIFEKLDEYENSLKYYLLARELLEILIKNNNDFDQRNNYKIALVVNISNIYEKQFQFQKEEKELESILTPELEKYWPNDYAIVIGNLGYVKTKLGNLKEGEDLMKEALSLSRKSGVDSNIVYKLHNLGKFYVDTNDSLQAIHYLKESLQLAEKLKSSDAVKVNLQLLSSVDISNTSYYDKRYITISDSLTKVQRKNRNKYARIEYETAVVEDANKELSNKNLYLIVGVVVLLGALGVRFIIGQRKEIAYRKQLQAAEMEFFELMQSSQIALNEARKDEQNRISRELHDNVMNRLYGTRLQLGMLNSIKNIEAEEKRLEQINSLQAIEHDIRAISHGLHNDDVASHFNFAVLLAQYVQQVSTTTTTTTSLHFEITPEIDWESISGLVKITIYRIVQEALTNVTKYASATECHITITQPNASTLLLRISDTGKGFDLAQISTGIGLKNMRERARLVKAELNIQSKIGQGTTIECRFMV
jgi:signal transduction histidine kinase